MTSTDFDDAASGPRELREDAAVLRDTLGELGIDAARVGRELREALTEAFDAAIFKGQSLSALLKEIGRDMSRTVLRDALAPVQGAANALIGQAAGGLASSLGSAASRVLAFADGGVLGPGVVQRPHVFPMQGGQAGLMGEAGPEAILPLARDASGRLGVRASGGGGVNVTVNIATPDVAGFRRSEGQVTAALARAVARGRRNL